jgi:hypothetical protein
VPPPADDIGRKVEAQSNPKKPKKEINTVFVPAQGSKDVGLE